MDNLITQERFSWQKHSSSKVLHCDFESYQDLLDFCEARRANEDLNDSLRYSRRNDFGGGWYGTRDFPSAMNLARNGWPDGLNQVYAISAGIDRLINQEVEGEEIIYSPVGYAPVVGAYLTGRPDSMMRIAEVEGARPVISIGYNISVSGGIDAGRIQAFGAALMALIMAFERAGYSTEITAFEATNSHGSSFSYTVPVKRAGHNLEPDRLVFAVAHPAMLRRLAFSIMENLDAENRNRFGVTGGGYGTPCTNSFWLKDRFTLMLEGKHLGAGNWENLDFCKSWILEQLEAQGVKLSGELVRE